jgi:hypothetical protein
MFFKTYNIIIILLLGIVSGIVFHNAAAQTNNTSNTFVDSNTGISFQYPSGWHVASKEYTNAIFGNSNTSSQSNHTLNKADKPVALVLPKSHSGASFMILSEILPFPMSVDKFLEANKKQLSSSQAVSMSKSIPISIGNLNGFKYNITSPTGLTQTQMYFVKGLKGFVIAHNLGKTAQSKDLADINSMFNSLKF